MADEIKPTDPVEILEDKAPVPLSKPDVLVPAPVDWHPGKSEWEALVARLDGVEAGVTEHKGLLGGLQNLLGPLIDAENEVKEQETAPKAKVPFWLRRIGG